MCDNNPSPFTRGCCVAPFEWVERIRVRAARRCRGRHGRVALSPSRWGGIVVVVALVLAYVVPAQGQLPPLESDVVR